MTLDLQQTSSLVRCTHPINVLEFLRQCHQQNNASALCIITNTEGGHVRAPGALIGVRHDGLMAGYMSNGCVDSDLALQAQKAIKNNQIMHLRYGAGSPYKDIRLPCGGGVDVMIIPFPDIKVLMIALSTLLKRAAGTLSISESDGTLSYHSGSVRIGSQAGTFHAPLVPRLCIRIAGQGAELIALSELARISSYDVIIETNDQSCLDYARDKAITVERLSTPETLITQHQNDPWMAFVLLFHDHEWDIAFLQQALSSQAFYIGAMGSRTVHQSRRTVLSAQGISSETIDRIYAPIGLIPARREAGSLAISILAEIVSIWGQHVHKMSESL